MKKLFLLLLFTPLLLLADPKITLQVLGSGGPESGDKRASSAYLIWIDGKSKILVDFGGGASLRFEEADAKIADLDVILLTHLHVDHTAEIPALVKSAFFTHASKTIHIFGSYKNRYMPSTTEFINRLFKDNNGAWQYLGDHLNGGARLQFKAHTVESSRQIKIIYQKGSICIKAITVHHGPIPAIAYRVDIGKRSITFSGDMNGEYHTLEKLAKNTDILVAHNAVPKGARGVGAKLHMTPIIIGQIAKKAKVKQLVLSHRMLRTLGREQETLTEIEKNYKGSTRFANDLSVYKIRSCI